MPIGNRRFDIQIGGKGYMLDRGSFRGRAWQRTGASDSPGRRSVTDVKYGELADEIDHPEVWDDWSGGYGYAYRRAGENTYHWAENFDARFPRQLCHAIELTATFYSHRGFIDVEVLGSGMDAERNRPGSGMVLAMGIRRIQAHFVNSAGWGQEHPILFSEGYTAGRAGRRAAMFGSFCYIPNWSGSAHFFQLNMLGSLVVSTNLFAHAFAVAGNQLWRTHPGINPIYLQNCADMSASGPNTNANWSATLTIGNGYDPAQDLISYGEQVFVSTKRGLYCGDQSGTFINVLDGMVTPHSDNGRDLCIHNNKVIYPHIGGVIAYDPLTGVATEIGPDAPMTRTTLPTPPSIVFGQPYDGSVRTQRLPLRGQIRAVRSFGGWLVAGMHISSGSMLIAGRESGGGFQWHTLQRIRTSTIQKVDTIHFDGITVQSGGMPGNAEGSYYDGMRDAMPTRLWVSTDLDPSASAWDVTDFKYQAKIPMNFGNPLDPVLTFTPRFCGSARIDLGAVDWNAPGTSKVYRAAEVWADNLASSAQWAKLYYSVDNESTRHLLGTTAKSPKDTLYFPSGEGSFVTGQSIALSLESFTASACVTPIYRAIVLRGSLRPKSVDQITAVINLADNQTDRQGSPINRPGSTMLTELRGFAQSNSPQQLIDLTGAMSYVNVMAPIQESETYQVGDNYPEMAAVVNMSVVDFG